jgi:inner membrane protein
MRTAALIVGANLPDVDAVTYFSTPMTDLAWRRGWTHGILAVVLLPLLLSGALVMLHRLRARRNRPVSTLQFKQLLVISFIAVLSHPILDTLNTYGVRWLMPFSGRWFYGDALFIVDPWVWLMLAAGVLWSWHRRRTGAREASRPAQWALTAFAAYASAMWVAGLTARTTVSAGVEASSGHHVLRAMAGPLPITLLARSYVAEQEAVYRVGTVHLLSLLADARPMYEYPRARPTHPAFAVAESTSAMRRFLSWARFPTFSVEQVGEGEYLVHVVDLRYAREPGHRFGSATIPIILREQ